MEWLLKSGFDYYYDYTALHFFFFFGAVYITLQILCLRVILIHSASFDIEWILTIYTCERIVGHL